MNELFVHYNDVYKCIVDPDESAMDVHGRPTFKGVHNMFLFERYFAVLKKYIRNRARPEGSIAKGYVTEKVILFCVDYVEELCPIGIPASHHEGQLIGKGTLGRKSVNATDHATLSKAHLTVLQQSAWWLHTWRSTCKLCEVYTL